MVERPRKFNKKRSWKLSPDTAPTKDYYSKAKVTWLQVNKHVNSIYFINNFSADLVLIVKCVDVAGFTRSGNNLIYTKKLALIDALMAKPVRLSTLDGRVL